MNGGGDVTNEQILQLTREIAGFGAKQDATLEMMREVKQDILNLKQDMSNHVSKAEHTAFKEQMTREMDEIKRQHEKEMADMQKKLSDAVTAMNGKVDTVAQAPKRWVQVVYQIVSVAPGAIALWTVLNGRK